MIEGYNVLSEFEALEQDKFGKYVEAMEAESLPEDEQYPIVFEDMPWFTCELTSLSRIAFTTADDPFYKSTRSKYYPELVLINSKSQIKAVINPMQPRVEKYASVFEYMEDFREPTLKVNDDKKIKINLGELMKDSKPGKMILLVAKCNDLRRHPPRAGEFDRAWFRIINEDTNQTLDYKNFKDIPKPEGFNEDLAHEEGADESGAPSLSYLVGRIFLDHNNRWVYESYNHTFTSDKFPDLYEKLAEIHQTSEEELRFQKEAINGVKVKLLEL